MFTELVKITQVPAQVQQALSDASSAPRVTYWGEGGGEAAAEEDTNIAPVPVAEMLQQGAVLVGSPAQGLELNPS